MKESVIQKGILDYLELYGRSNPCYWFRAGSGAVKTQQGRFFRSGKPGCPDIVLCLTCKNSRGIYIGVFVGMEVKTDKGRQSKTQKDAEKNIISAGGYYYIIRSISDAKKAIKEIREKVFKL